MSANSTTDAHANDMRARRRRNVILGILVAGIAVMSYAAIFLRLA